MASGHWGGPGEDLAPAALTVSGYADTAQ